MGWRNPMRIAINWFVWLCFCLSPAWVFASQKEIVRFALLVGNNAGNKLDRPLRYAERDVQRLHNTLKDLGGFAPRRTRVLLGKDDNQLTKAIEQIEQQIKQLRKTSPKQPTMLLFYYSGHADTKAMHLGRTPVAFTWIRARLKRSSAQVKVGIFDTCQSAQMIRKKGARRTNKQVKLPPQISNLTTEGEAIITSSGKGEDSHELERLKGSIFTHYLISGLRGAADANADTKVTLNEVYNYAYQHTITHTLFLSSGIQHPSFRNELRGHGQLILTHPRKSFAQLHFGKQLDGTYYILNKHKRTLAAELIKKKGAYQVLGLHQGQYIVIRRGQRNYHVQNVILSKGQRARVQNNKMEVLSYGSSASKGIGRILPIPERPQSTMQTALYASLGIVGFGLLSTGALYGFGYQQYAQAEQSLKNSRRDAKAEQNSASLLTGGHAALGVTAAAGATAVLFYMLDQQQAAKTPIQLTPQLASNPKRTPLITFVHTK
ncbi:MAG: hypothetical protein CL920_05060 [Deltaproteobacteria bacterium]|nr:hypothetical protein [Deltaproteobacteria bacterium]MBU48050.1 hypothetical protein [Deltaproteobacteria bacterium]